MTALFRPIIEVGAMLFVKENYQFACGQTILRPAKGKSIHACLLRDLSRRTPERGNGIRKASTVQVQKHLPLLREC